MTTTDHAQEAVGALIKSREWLEDEEFARADLAVKRAQVHATLAVAEQLRIANLVALGSIGAAHRVLADQVSADAAKTLAEFHAHETPEVGGWWQLRPEIATRLGLDGGADS